MNDTFTIDGAVRLDHWGVIRARGDDAPGFLQGQLTNDVASLAADRARLAGFCSAKGRLQATFVVWKDAGGDLLLACAASVLPATLKRLSMFVLRAKCKLSDAGSEVAVWGLAGAAARRSLADEAPVWAVQRPDDGATTLIRLADAAGQPRCLWIGSPGAEGPASEAGHPLDRPAIDVAGWRWLEVRSGLPMIESATVDQFVPQMLNYELLGGVDFRKGCYPGQEVVARSQYRGSVKRRMFLFDIPFDDDAAAAGSAAAPGREVFHSADPGQPAGMVVNAAPRPDGSGASALVEVKLSALDAGTLHLGAVDGPLLHRAALPYPVPAEASAPV